MHQYGKYVRVLDLSQLEVEHNRLLSVLECCNRLEVLILGNQELKKKTINEICSRSKYLRTFKLTDIEIKEPDAMAALGKYCHNLEELSLKKEIACSGEILLSIVKNCPKLFKLEIEGKDYNNQTLYKILEHCPNILTLNINQCMNITDELLIATYKLCTNLKKLSFKKIFEITENFVISTLNHFPRTSTIVISNIDRMFQSSIEVDGEKIFLVANLCDVDIHRIIDFYSIKEDGLQELTFIDDIMNALENLKDLQIFTVKFSSVDHEAFFENDKEQLVKYCPKLKAIKWHFQKIYIKDNNHYHSELLLPIEADFASSSQEDEEEINDNDNDDNDDINNGENYNEEQIFYEKYLILKIKHQYIQKENELLADEYQLIKKKLKRLKIEKFILLDALETIKHIHNVSYAQKFW
ncbi:9588_t:CDS:2 [Entrophospora sp. SA101]|nr:9588_t:CDS:2 [Entrophospora sp. SA101]